MFEIRVGCAAASAPTGLAAFDRCLQQIGVHDLNLIPLSSVIPAAAKIVRARCNPAEFVVGDRLSCVMASERATEPGTEAWAGLGWAVASDGGLFVEAHGRSHHQVDFELSATLHELTTDRSGRDWGGADFEMTGITCESEPVCALAIAVYETMPWGLRR